MTKHRILSVFLVVILVFLGYFLFASERAAGPFSGFPFRYGLDLNGGTELTYRIDTTNVGADEVDDSTATLREVIERRVNAFGVSEAVVQIEKAGIVTGNPEHRLIVELPGVTDTDRAIGIIGQTPTLEFKLLPLTAQDFITQYPGMIPEQKPELFVQTGLTGRLLQRSNLEFRQVAAGAAIPNEPTVTLVWNDEGRELFASVTRENVGKFIGIFLDGELISAPTVREEIPNGQAIISGNFTPEEARSLVRNLNYGALPVPIELASTQVIGASLGAEAKTLGIQAGVWALMLVGLFLVLWYRLPGFAAVLGLLMYIGLSLAVFKLVPVTLTAAGIAGFIISMGMAIDANVLIFERMKDEFKSGKRLHEAVSEGFKRAWLPVRDANLSGLITAVILYWLGNAAVKGFALTLGVGNIVSMFTAITVTRTLLFALAGNEVNETRLTNFLFGKKA